MKVKRLHGTIARGGQREWRISPLMKTRKRSQSVYWSDRGGGVDPFCRRAEDKIPIGMYWSEGLAGLIPFADDLKERSKSI